MKREIKLWLCSVFLGWSYDVLPKHECYEVKKEIVKAMFKLSKPDKPCQ